MSLNKLIKTDLWSMSCRMEETRLRLVYWNPKNWTLYVGLWPSSTNQQSVQFPQLRLTARLR